MLANWSTGRRGRFAAGFVALVGSISLSVVSRGCSSEALRLWAADEIVLAGAGNVEDGHRNFSVLLSIKNIDGMPNGRYAVRPPRFWDRLPRRPGADGIDDVLLPSPLILTDASRDGGWGQWDIKVSEVPIDRVRNRVSSFFKKTTGDGSVPGEFSRLGISIAHDAARTYRLILWGEDLATDHWLHLATVNIGRGTQSAARKIVEPILLPLSFAVDWGIVPLVSLWIVCRAAVGRRFGGAVAIGIVGIAFLATCAFEQIAAARENAEIRRALSPLVNAPLDTLQSPAGRSFEIAIPNDAEWRRIERRMGPPAFLIIAADQPRRRIYAPAEVGLALHIEKNGSDVVAAPSGHVPYTYSSDSAQKGFEFTAAPGDHVTIHARVTAANVPSDVSLLLTPDWNSFEMWDWVDGAAMGFGLGGVIALVLAIVGVALVGVAVALAMRERLHARTSNP